MDSFWCHFEPKILTKIQSKINTFLIKKNIAHGAFLGLNYSDTDIDGYTSGNANSRTALKIDSTSSETWDSEIGYQLQYGFDLMGTPAKLQSKLAYVHVIEDGLVDRLSTRSFADGQKRDIIRPLAKVIF